MKARLLALLWARRPRLRRCVQGPHRSRRVFTRLTGSQWSADFVVTGDGAPSVISDFTCIFPKLPLQRSRSGASPAGWDSLIVQPDTALHSPGFFDSLALGAGIGTGASVGGFDAVKFSFLGGGSSAPAALRHQRCEFPRRLLGPDDVTAVAAVPEPETVGSSSSGWVLLQAVGMRQNRQQLLSRSAHEALSLSADSWRSRRQ